MADQRSRLTMDILARVRGEQDVNRMSAAINRTGDAMDDSASDADRLQRGIDEVSDEISELNRELLRTGDIEIFKKIQDRRGALQQLQKMRKEIGGIAETGADAGKTFSKGFGAALGAIPPRLKGAIIAGVAGGAVAAAPLVGAAVSAAVTGGVGLGGIAGGVVAAAQDPAVQRAASGLVNQLSVPFSELGDAFVGPTIGALEEIGDAATDVFNDLMPELKALAPLVTDLGQGVGDALRALGPGLGAALEAARPIIEMIADRLPAIGSAVGLMFEIIAGGGEGATDGLRTIFDMVELIVVSTGLFVRGLTEAFELIGDIAESVPLIGDAFKETKDVAGGTLAVILGTVAAVGGGAVAAAQTSSTIVQAFNRETEAVEETITKLQLHNDILRAQTDPTFALIRAQTGLTEAQDAYNSAVDEFGEGSKEAEAAEIAMAEAAVKLHGAVGDVTDEMHQGMTPQLRATLEASGATEAEIESLEDRLITARGAAERWAKRFEQTLITNFETDGTPPPILPGGMAAVPVQHGGEIHGPPGIDRVPARLTAGEFVVRREAAQRHMELLRTINSGGSPGGIRPVASGGDGGTSGGINVHVRAFSDQFNLQQVLDDLALRGAV